MFEESTRAVRLRNVERIEVSGRWEKKTPSPHKPLLVQVLRHERSTHAISLLSFLRGIAGIFQAPPTHRGKHNRRWWLRDLNVGGLKSRKKLQVFPLLSLFLSSLCGKKRSLVAIEADSKCDCTLKKRPSVHAPSFLDRRPRGKRGDKL